MRKLYKKAMKDFENLTTEEQGNVIMQIGSKLTGQEIWYWEGIVHLLRTYQDRINKAIEYIDTHSFYYIDTPYKLLDILKGSDKE